MLAVLTAVSVREVGLSGGALVEGIGDIRRLVARMLPPALPELGTSLDLLLETVSIALLGTTLALALSLPLAFLAARNTSPHPAAYGAARAVITAARAIPDLVFALVFVRALGLGALPGVLALGLHSVGMLGKLFADAIEETDRGAREAAASTGAGRLQVITSSVLPQIVPSVVGLFLYRFDINVRLSTVLGFVGAGGIGQQLRATLGNLRYPEAMGTVALIFVLIVGVEVLSVAVRRTLLADEGAGVRDGSVLAFLGRRGRRRQAQVPPTEVAGAIRPPWTVERRWKAAYGVALLAALAMSMGGTGVNPLQVVAAVPDIWGVVQRFWPPDFSSGTDLLIDGMVETVAIGIAATFIGTVLSVPIAFLAAGNIAPARWVYVAARTVIVVVRSIPELILAVVFVAAVGLGPFPGTLALGIGTIGFMAKLLSDALEELPQGPRDALDAVGATRMQQTATAVVPQVTPTLVGQTLYMLDINIRSSVVLGIVGAGGIGFLLVQSIRTLAFERTAAVLLLVFAVVYLVEHLSAWLRRQLI